MGQHPRNFALENNKLINLKTQNGMETKKKYFMDCHLAGRMYHDADTVWNQLMVGTKVKRNMKN